MPLSQESLERQLKIARDELASWVKALDEQGVDKTARRRDPRWRQLNSNCNALQRRIKAAKATIALDEELKARKASNESAEEEAAGEE